MPEVTEINIVELLALIGEKTVIARRQEQKISELQSRIKELEARLVIKDG